jgi:hypothetical protein
MVDGLHGCRENIMLCGMVRRDKTGAAAYAHPIDVLSRASRPLLGTWRRAYTIGTEVSRAMCDSPEHFRRVLIVASIAIAIGFCAHRRGSSRAHGEGLRCKRDGPAATNKTSMRQPSRIVPPMGSWMG